MTLKLIYFPFQGIVSWFCPCITYGQIKHRYEHLNNKGYPDPERGGCCSSDCMLHGCLLYFGFGWALQVHKYIAIFVVPERILKTTVSRWDFVAPSEEDTRSRVGVVATVVPLSGALLANLPRNLGNWN